MSLYPRVKPFHVDRVNEDQVQSQMPKQPRHPNAQIPCTSAANLNPQTVDAV